MSLTQCPLHTPTWWVIGLRGSCQGPGQCATLTQEVVLGGFMSWLCIWAVNSGQDPSTPHVQDILALTGSSCHVGPFQSGQHCLRPNQGCPQHVP